MTNSMNPIDQLTSNVSKGVARQLIKTGKDSFISNAEQQVDRKLGEVTIQEIVTGSGSQLQGVSQQAKFQTTVKAAEYDFFFDMMLSKVVLDEAGHEQFIQLNFTDVLEPGCTYVVRVAISLDRYSFEQGERSSWKMKQSGVRNRGQMLFLVQELYPAGEEGAIETCEPVKTEVPEAEFDSWHQEITIKVKASHTLETTKLQLIYQSANLFPREATTLEVGLSRPVEQVTLPEEMRCYLAVDAEPPAQTAILHIYPTGQNQALCTRWFKEQKDAPRSFDSLELPQILPGDSAIEYLQASERGLNDLARNETAGVGLWFEEVLNAKINISCIVLIDQTEMQLPWEMFKLSNGEYLGARLVVVRWVVEKHRGRKVELLLDRISQEGHVMVYSAGPPPSKSVLRNLDHEPCDQLSSLQYSLLAPENGSIAGLVYLNCQNLLTYGDEAETIDHLLNAARQGEELRFDDVAEQLSHRPIFWVSTPYSGRMIWKDGKTCGFMKAALTQVASGYIGTLAAIDDPRFAESVANELMKHACSDGVNPARFLKQLRAVCAQKFQKAVKSRNPEEIRKQKRLLLYAFTYVYYGNPQVSLRLIPYRSSGA